MGVRKASGGGKYSRRTISDGVKSLIDVTKWVYPPKGGSSDDHRRVGEICTKLVGILKEGVPMSYPCC
jgi:hypothetical protein